MTFNSNWGYSDVEGIVSDYGSFNDQDEPTQLFHVNMSLPSEVFRHVFVRNENCYLLSIVSDYEKRSVQSVISYLWVRNQIYSYSLTTANNGDESLSRDIVAFATHISHLESEIQRIKLDLRLVLNVRKFDDVGENDTTECAENMDHHQHILIQHIYTSLMLGPDWFSCEIEDDYSYCAGGMLSKKVVGDSVGGETKQLDVVKFKSLCIDNSSGCVRLAIAVYSCNYISVHPSAITRSMNVTCLCSGEEFSFLYDEVTVVSADGGVSSLSKNAASVLSGVDPKFNNCSSKKATSEFLAKRSETFSANSPFLSRLDESNISHGFCLYMPSSFHTFAKYYWYRFGFSPISDPNEENILSEGIEETEDCGDDLFMDLNMTSNTGNDKLGLVYQKSGSNYSKSDNEEATIAVAYVLSASGPRVYPVSLLAARKPHEILARSRRQSEIIAQTFVDSIQACSLLKKAAISVNKIGEKNKTSISSQVKFVTAKSMKKGNYTNKSRI